MEILKNNQNTITLSGVELPIRCDLYVLEQIQEKYTDLSAYEYKLIGFTPERDEFGDVVLNDNGNTVGKFGVPDIKVVADTLHMMVNEGLEYEGAGETFSVIELKRMVDLSITELSSILHEEYMSCFRRKNQTAMQSQETAPER